MLRTTLRLLTRVAAVLTLTTALVAPTYASSNLRAFQPRYQVTTGRVASYLIGNQILNCQAAVAGCTAAQNGAGNNNDFQMRRVDVDADPVTFDSSSATLTFPAGATVRKAFLYWGADTSSAGGSGDLAAPTPTDRNKVKLAVPGGGYQTIVADQVDPTGTRYSAVANVTAQVTAGGAGVYTVADLQAGTGADRYGGWSLVVIFDDATAPLRSVTLFDGSSTVNQTAPSDVNITVSGFRTPATGVVGARIGLVAFEGDNNFTGDQFQVNGNQLSDALNPATNVFNSTNSRLGVAQTGRAPQQSNMFGFDVDFIAVSEGVIANSATSANLTFTSTSETYYPIALLFVTNVYEPDVVANFTKNVADVSGSGYHPGDQVEYTVSVSNTGDDTSDTTVVTDTLPAGVTFVPGSIRITAGANAGAKTDATGDDQADYDAATRKLTFRLGTGADGTTGGSLLPVAAGGTVQTVKFLVTIDAAQANGATVSNVAGISYVGGTSGTVGSGTTSPATSFTVTNAADVSITKTGPANVATGGAISYLVSVNSIGPDPADGATVTDNVPAGITGVSITCAASGGAVCPSTAGLTTLSALAIPALPSGGSVAFTINGTAPLVATTLNNSASVAMPAGVNDPTPANNSVGPIATSVDAPADLAVVTGAPASVNAGQNITYTITLTNNGPAAASNVSLSDTVPAGLTFVSFTSPAGWSAATPVVGGTGTIIATKGSVAAGASATFTLVLNVPASTADATVVTDTATAATTTPDSNSANDSSSAATTVSAGADLSLSKTLTTAGPFAQGQTIHYTIVVSNAGPLAATGVNVTDTPSNLAITAVSGAGCAALPCTIASIASGANATIDVDATITAAGAFDNGAAASAAQNDPNVGDNSDTTGNGGTAAPSADLAVTNVLGSASPAPAGSVVSYTITVTNNGPSAVAGASLDETVPPQLSGVTWTCTSGCAASGTGNVSTTLNLAFGASATITVTGTAPATTPSTIAIATATVTPPAGTVDPNPANNSASAPAVPVSALPIDAIDDAGSTGGASGGTAIANVLGNDTFNGGSATSANVTLSQVSTSNANVTLNAGTGAVNVAAGTPSGTYTVTYRICETANAANCDSAFATVTVTSATLVANNDAGTANGQTGATAVANVLGNDTLNGGSANTSNVTLTQVSTSNPGVTLNVATGAVNVAAGTPAGTYTLGYRICEAINPSNCTTATVTVTVTAAVIDAVNDAAGPVEGSARATGVVNVLGNDTLGGTPATTSTVTVTPASNGPLTLNANGSVDVAPNTAAGTYVLTYTICEQLNPTNCDTATVSVTVSAAAIAASDDAPPAVNGASGGTAIGNVLANDTLGSATPTTSTVTLSQVSTSNPSIALNVATGAVNVAPGTPAGTYALAYRICQQLNPTNCDNATVTVTVSAAAIDAANDSTPAINGVAGNANAVNVLGNDTLNAAAATTSNITLTQVSTTNPGVTLNTSTGNLAVAAGTPAGNYSLTYRICEKLNPANCDTATVAVNVVAPTLVASNDSGTTTQNIAIVVPVLANDTMAGAPVTSGSVTLTVTSAPTHGATVVNSNGTVTYTPATNYSGTDSFVYKICDVVNPTVCSSATASLAVAPNTIDAIDQALNTPQTGPIVIDPMRSTINRGGAPLDPGSVQVVTAPANGTAVVNPNGSITYTPNQLFFGTDTFRYRICDRSTPTPVCDTATVTITVAMQAPHLRLVKTVPTRAVKIGDLVRYTVRVENTGISPANNATVVDTPPQGFTYVEGSLSVDDTDHRFVLAGTQPIRINGVDVPVGGHATIVYLLRVGAGVGHGTHTNTVSATDATGTMVSNTASADVTVEGDPTMDDSLILGTVFLDRNGDGLQQADEPGLPGVRIASVEGLVIETDVYGRYHVAGITPSNAMRGSNFILKVDAATLPPGAVFTTSNPLVRRITPGIPVRFDFGVRLPDGSDASDNATR